MTRTIIYAIHGFLGQPSDWNMLSIKSLSVEAFVPVDLSKIKIDSTEFWEWSAEFNNLIKQDGFDRRILIGYSLGGRLAIHALIQCPSIWSSAVLISAHPGMKAQLEKQMRMEEDKQWAQRFKMEPWDRLMRAWNSREVFSGYDPIFERKEADYSRETLASMLNQFSLGKQEDLSSHISDLPFPILWASGAHDRRYAEISATISLKHELSKVWIVPNAGHRIPWEVPEAFQLQLIQWIHN